MNYHIVEYLGKLVGVVHICVLSLIKVNESVIFGNMSRQSVNARLMVKYITNCVIFLLHEAIDSSKW